MHQQSKSRPSSNISSGLQKVWQVSQKDGEQLSPVDLTIEEACPIHLAPLVWTHYQQPPTHMTVRNSGFTVMINASFDGEAPYVSSGPLRGSYVFSQIHFHWGEHNQTGSGHAVDGARYPLEMHVVHLKKDYANMREALQSKDGIAVMVYLFALREERNTQMDQLTAILQFIQHPRGCARLHSTALSEIVHPFINDYFLYWGAVGSPMGQYRILWMVSRNVLPVSTQQLEEFRQLYDSQGNLLVSNSSRPHPLGGRTLFLVSPSEQLKETMYGITHRPMRKQGDTDSSIDISDAEYNSLADLEDDENKNCRICPAKERLKNITNINVEYPFKVNEGDTSVEESCIDLSNSTDDDGGVTVKTETKYKNNTSGRRVTNVTNVNVTACRHKCKTRYTPSEIYSVVSTRGSELHLRRKPMIVRQHDRSMEQACMLLNPTRSSSAPSMATRPDPVPVTHLGSEMAVYPERGSETKQYRGDHRVIPYDEQNTYNQGNYQSEISEYEKETYEENLRSSKQSRRVKVLDNDYSKYIMNQRIGNQELSEVGKSEKPQFQTDYQSPHNQHDTCWGYKELYQEDTNETEDKKQSQYLLVKQIQDKQPFYKVIGELPSRCNINQPPSKDITTTNNEIENDQTRKPGEDAMVLDNRGNSYYSEFRQDQAYSKKENKKMSHKHAISNKPTPQLPNNNFAKNEEEVKTIKDHNKTKKELKECPKHEINLKKERDPYYRVSLLVRTTVSDHRKPEKRGKEPAKKYYVTKISPKEKPIFVTPKSSDSKFDGRCYGKTNKEHLYYANPIMEKEQKEYNDLPDATTDYGYTKEEDYMSEYEESREEIHEQSRKEHHLITKGQEKVNEQNRSLQPFETVESSLNITKPLDDSNVNNRRSYNHQEVVEDERVGLHHDNAHKYVSERYSSSEVNDTRTKTNLKEQINIYHGKNAPDENVRVVDKIVTGKVGKSHSTEVFVQGKHVEVVNPRKTDVSKEVKYNLVTSKHPEPQYYIKEPQKNSGGRAVIQQHLSLDQQVKGHSQIRQKVEYHDNRTQKATDIPDKTLQPNLPEEKQQKCRSDRNMTETFEESNHEMTSTTRKTEHAYKHILQDESIHPKYIQDKFNENEDYSIEQQKDKLTRQQHLDPNPVQLKSKAHTADNPDLTSKDVSRKSEVDPSNKNYITDINDKKLQHFKDPKNVGVSSYEYDETSSINKRLESSKKKKVQYFNEQLPDKKLRVSFQNDTDKTTETIAKCDPSDLLVKDNHQLNKVDDHGIEFEEIIEEDSVYTSKKMKEKKISTQMRGEPSYKTPHRTRPELSAPSDHTIQVNKIEIPEPHYITRVPRQPLIEFEAFPVDPHEPFEIVTETQETTSSVKTHKTYMMFKKINGKAVLNQPSVIEPMKINRNEQLRLSDTNTKCVIPKDIVRADQSLSVCSTNKVFIEEYDEENITQDKQSRSVSRKQFRGPTPLEVKERTPQMIDNQIKDNCRKNASEEQPSTSKQRHSEAVTLRKPLAQPPVPYDPEIKIFTEYEYSETSLLSEQKFSRKQKRYMYNVHQPPVYEEPTTPLLNNSRQAIETKENCSKGKSTQRDDLETQHKNKVPSMPTQTGTNKDRRIVRDNTSQSIIVDSDDPYQNAGQFIDQEYFESSTNKNKSYKSSKKQFTSTKKMEIDPELHHTLLQDKDYLDNQDEPTKDTTTARGGPEANTTRSGSFNEYHAMSFQGEKSNLPPVKSVGNSVTKTDGDIVIYIRQPRVKNEHVLPKITVDVSDKHKMTPAEAEKQRVKVNEVKRNKPATRKKLINPRKSKSENIYRLSNSSEMSSEEDRETYFKSESTEEHLLDTTHYNMTLKSQTQVDPPIGEKARLRSWAEITNKPNNSRHQVDAVPHQHKFETTEERDSSYDESTSSNCENQCNQSPIRIDSTAAVTKQYPRLQFINHWNASGDGLLENNGKTLRASLPDFKNLPYIKGGPLKSEYSFVELHFHWGYKDCCGAEHVIDGQRHSLEAHFLYVKKEYGSLEKGMGFTDGLASIGVKFEVGGAPHPQLGELVKDIHLIREADTGIYIPVHALFSWLKPAIEKSKGYFSYKGMLTKNPPCIDSVTWLIFPEPILFCCQQSSEFRKLKTSTGEELRRNFRTPQPLNNRDVYYVPIVG